MKSAYDNIVIKANEIKTMINSLINEYSSIRRWNDNSKNNGIVFFMGDYAWNELPLEGKQLQSKILEEYTNFSELILFLIENRPDNEINILKKEKETFLTVINQNKILWSCSKSDYLEQAIQSIDKQIKLLDGVYNHIDKAILLIPDTNALLNNPDIEKWQFEGVKSFCVVLLPTVLNELDKLKMGNKKEELRDKARTIIKRIKEYRRRGNIFDGVTLSGKNTICSIAIEPNFENTLSWLSPDNNDDRIIASCFGVIKKQPHSIVILITADINMQNKADFAKINFFEPPKSI